MRKSRAFLLFVLLLLSACAAVKTLDTPGPGSAADGSSAARPEPYDAPFSFSGSSQVLSAISSGIFPSALQSRRTGRGPAFQSTKPLSSPQQSSLKPTGVVRMAAVKAVMPQAPGIKVFSQQGAAMDYSNASQGYIMVKYDGASAVKVLVYFNGGSFYYQYSVGGSYVTIPLQSGSGLYRVRFMQKVSDDQFAELCSQEINAQVSGQGCFLYPNQFVNYTPSSAAVIKAAALCSDSWNNSRKVSAVFQFIKSNIKYDYDKAKNVKSGYIPNADSTLAVRKGICFDYAALMAAMCRSQGIATKLVIGHTSYGYHAWNEVYLDGWKRYDPTFEAAGQSAKNYTAEKYY